MSEEQGPTGGVTAHLSIGDGRAAEAIDFYKAAFGAIEHVRMPADDGRRLMHAHLGINGGAIMLADTFPEYDPSISPPGGFVLHLQVDDADVWHDRAVAAGAVSVMPPADMFWGDRYGQIRDPFGHRWSIGAPIAK